MSEFVLIAPEGWTQIDTFYYENNTDLTKQYIRDAAPSSVLECAERVMRDHGELSADKFLAELRVINDEFWARTEAY